MIKDSSNKFSFTVQHCIICKCNILPDVPEAAKNIFEDVTITTCTILSKFICKLLKRSPELIMFSVSAFYLSDF